MTHECNSQVKETKALTLIQEYETFKMEEDEMVETMFSRFQTLVAGLKVIIFLIMLRISTKVYPRNGDIW